MTTEPTDTDMLIDMLRYRRGEGSRTQKIFCKRFIQPVFGKPDSNGNYVLQVGDNPRVAFTAHHDSCHTSEGFQKIFVEDGYAYLHPSCVDTDMVLGAEKSKKKRSKNKSNCLGADDAVGIWIILNLINAGVEATYCLFAGEECGGIGSLAMVNSNPDWINHTDLMVSFDRRGYHDVITRQSGQECLHENVAREICDQLNNNPVAVLDYKPSPMGMFTDSANFIGNIPNCTNFSVGYEFEHTSDEYTDLEFAESLADALPHLDWEYICDVARTYPAEPTNRDFGHNSSLWGPGHIL